MALILMDLDRFKEIKIGLVGIRVRPHPWHDVLPGQRPYRPARTG